MKRIGLIVNSIRDKDFSCAERVTDVLERHGFDVCLYEPLAWSRETAVISDSSFFSSVDCIVTLGGDGTILHIADQAARSHTPILGINLGHLGYLTRLRPDETDRLPDILSGAVDTENRAMLAVTLAMRDGSEQEHIVLNDAVITRNAPSKTVRLELRVGGEYVYTYQSDGLIFATPTGSTAYSLSSGGPIADSGLQDIMLVNPICEHSLFSKTLLFSAQDELSCTQANGGERAVLSLDGKLTVPFETVLEMRVTRSAYTLPLIRPDGNKFYQILNLKFSDRGVR